MHGFVCADNNKNMWEASLASEKKEKGHYSKP